LTGAKVVLVSLAFTLGKPVSADLYCPGSALPDTDTSNLQTKCHPGDVIQLEAKRIGLVGARSGWWSWRSRRRAQRKALADAVYQPASEPLASVRADIQTSEIACSITWFRASSG
jgi:hypothetical protein